MTEDLIEWLRKVFEEQLEEVDTSRALSPNDLHWSMPSWLDRNYLTADIRAKLAILDLHEHQRYEQPLYAESWSEEDRRAAFSEDPKYVGCKYCHSDYDEGPQPSWWCETVRILSAPYAQRPDMWPGWRDEWMEGMSSDTAIRGIYQSVEPKTD